MTIQQLKARALANSDVQAEYKKLDAEFALIDMLLTMRKKACLTQDDVAKRMGTQRSNISRLEKGSTNPSWKTLQSYAYACGFKLDMKFRAMREG